VTRLVFLDESGLNAAMTRSHAWVRKGREYIERTPMNWGNNLTLLGAIRLTGWVLQSAMYATTNSDRFVAWLATQLLPRLKKGDVLVMDNLKAHHDDRVGLWCGVLVFASSTCRRIRTTSTRSSRDGHSRNSSSAVMPPEQRTP